MEKPCITEKGNQEVLLVDGKPFIMLAGEVHNSDSSSPAYMEQIWKIAEELGMNSLLLPVTWEMVEPVEGEFHFEVLDQLIDQAREYGMKIGLLWFGSIIFQTKFQPGWNLNRKTICWNLFCVIVLLLCPGKKEVLTWLNKNT